MKTAVAWFADNHVAANLLMWFLLLTGIYTGLTTKVEVFPETELDLIRVTTSYPGASPAEVEEGIVRQIEEKIAGLAGIKRIDSVAREGSATVTIEVIKDWDIKKLLEEVKAEVDRLTTLPEEAEKPVVREITRRSRVINVAIYGDADEATLKNLAEAVKDDITNLPDITVAEIFSARTPEIHVEISEATLRRYELPLEQVAESIRKASLDMPAGRVKTAGGEILIRTKGRRYIAEDYREMNPCREHNFCCGGGGGLNGIGRYRPQRNVGMKIKRDQILATGAKLVVAPCHNCWDAIRDMEEIYKIGIRWSFLKPLLISMVEVPEHLKPEE